MADDADALDQEQPETPEIENEEGQEPEEGEGEEQDEVSFGGEPAPQPGGDTGLAKHLRGEIAKRDRELAELRAKVQPAQKIEVGQRPKLEDFGYDSDKYDEAVDQWHTRKREAEAQDARANQATDEEQRARDEWNRDHQSYMAKRANLAFADKEEVEAAALTVLSPAQQVAIVQTADDPALFLYALGKNPAKLAEIAASSNNPAKLAKLITKLEGTITVNRSRRPPDPERIPTPTGRINHSGNEKKLADLEKEADRTGDRSKVIAFKKQHDIK